MGKLIFTPKLLNLMLLVYWVNASVHVSTIKRNMGPLLVISKEVGLEANAEKIVYSCLSHNINTCNMSLKNLKLFVFRKYNKKYKCKEEYSEVV